MDKRVWVPLVFISAGCTSVPPECPDHEVPAVVKVVVTERFILPTPPPPDYQKCIDLKAAYHNFIEADEARIRCEKLIEENNKEAE